MLDILEGKNGVISVLNEECLIPKGNDLTFLSKVKSACGPQAAFSVAVAAPDEFAILHYAGKVRNNHQQQHNKTGTNHNTNKHPDQYQHHYKGLTKFHVEVLNIIKITTMK